MAVSWKKSFLRLISFLNYNTEYTHNVTVICLLNLWPYFMFAIGSEDEGKRILHFMVSIIEEVIPFTNPNFVELCLTQNFVACVSRLC